MDTPDPAGPRDAAHDADEALAPRLRSLPRWAAVAFAVRCVERVVDLMTDEHRGTIQRVLDTAATAAATAADEDYRTDVLDTAGACAAAAAILDLAHLDRLECVAADLAADAAAHAAIAADVLENPRAVEAAIIAVGQAEAAYGAAVEDDAATHAYGAYLDAVFDDLDRLERESREGVWNNHTPVSQGIFGPLWPEAPDATDP